VRVGLAQSVEDGLGVALPGAAVPGAPELVAAEPELVAAEPELAVAAAVWPLLLADTSGLALTLGLPLSVDGLVGGVVSGVSVGLADVELLRLGVRDVFAWAEGQDAAGFGLLDAAPLAAAPVPLALTGPPPECAGVA